MKMTSITTVWKFLTIIVLATFITACSSDDDEFTEAIRADLASDSGVNALLWRAAIDTLSAFPISQADAVGGVILTDWFANPDSATERLKISVFILDSSLRADALEVSVIRQELIGGVWTSAPVRAGTELQIEDTILTRARQLRIRTIEN